ncbi:MAG: hypothetical protein ABIG71_02390 [Candidatus Uhrbacteria bacterium]
MRRIVVTLVVALVLVCCATRAEIRIDNVERVLMHEPNRYSLFTRSSDDSDRLTHHNIFTEPTIVTDAPGGEPMWATWTQYSDGCDGTIYRNFVIHIHSARDINGAGWDRGKNGRGQTTVIE